MKVNRKKYGLSALLLTVGAIAMAGTMTQTVNKNPGERHRDLVEDIYANFATGNMEGSLAAMDEHIVWEHPEHMAIPFAKTFHGHDGVRSFFELAMGNIDVLDQQVQQLVASGNTVVALGFEKMRVKANGNVYQSPWAHVYTFENGKVVKFQEFIDTAEMVAAFSDGDT